MASPPLGPILRNLRTLTGRQHAARSDADLLARFVADRDETAFEALVWRHGALVYRLGQRLLGREADVEDAFQATFLILARDAARIGRRDSLAGWLYRVAYRVALRARRRYRSFEPLPDDLIGPDGEPADRTTERERHGLLLDEIARLPECYRLAVVLCCLEGKSNVQAAGELGCPCGTVDSRLAWARRRLRERLVRRGVAPAVAAALIAGMAWEARAVPPALARATAPLAVALVHGGPDALSGAVSAETLNLFRGVQPMWSLSKVKLIAACVVLAALVGVGAHGRKDVQLAAQPPAAAGKTADAPARPAESEWRLKASFKVAAVGVSGLAFSPDGKTIATASRTGEKLAGVIEIHDSETGKALNKWPIENSVRSVAFSPDGKYLATVEDVGAAVMRRLSPFAHLDKVVGIEVMGYSARGDTYMGTRNGKVFVARERPPRSGDVGDRDGDKVAGVAMSPDGRRVAFTAGNQLRVEDMDAGKVVWEFAQKPELRDVVYSPDGKLIMVAGLDQVHFLDAQTGKAVRVINTGGQGQPSIAISPDGRTLAVVFGLHDDGVNRSDRDVSLFDVATGKLVVKLPGHKHPVSYVAFSTDGRLLATGDAGGIVNLWAKSEKPPAAAPARTGDRLDNLVQQLARSGRSNEQCVEALFLTALGRLPAEPELKFTVERVAKAADRAEALRDVLWALVNTKESKLHIEALQKAPGIAK